VQLSPLKKKHLLDAWRARVGVGKAKEITKSASDRGTAMHNIIEKFLLGQGYLDLTDVGKDAQTMAQQIIDKGLKDRLSEFWGLEVTLYYPGLYAGATDVVGIYDNEESIVDFKQSNQIKKREWIGDYKLQLAAYALAHNEIYGTNIQRGVNLICTKDNYFQEFVFEGEEFRRAKFDWLRRVDEFYKLQG
jgi:ATP-dependent exoDNAse (exonuclease V) beta subunit